jgi:uncharacterized protein YhhL (DUF1145 family)
MTNTEFWGLLALMACLCAMGAWLQLQRATAVERRKKRSDFRMCLVVSAAFIGLFGLNFIYPFPGPAPSLTSSICVSLFFLLMLGIAMIELRLTIRARNADHQRSPADSDS